MENEIHEIIHGESLQSLNEIDWLAFEKEQSTEFSKRFELSSFYLQQIQNIKGNKNENLLNELKNQITENLNQVRKFISF